MEHGQTISLYDFRKMRETVEIDFSESFGQAIPCIENTVSDKYNVYLAIISGQLFASIYDEQHGPCLPERNAILGIENTASKLINTLNLADSIFNRDLQVYPTITDSHSKVQDFFEYCKTMHLTYSYKPVLVMAFFKCANRDGVMKIADGIK